MNAPGAIGEPRRGGASPRRNGRSDVELNLAPIIDCFTVLITFLLASASFLSIGVIEAGAEGAGAAAEPARMRIAVTLHRDGSIGVKTEGSRNIRRVIPPQSGGSRDLDGLGRALDGLARDEPAVRSATIGADDTVAYAEIVEAIERASRTHPAASLAVSPAGFGEEN
jgi:biopolymer transport protein ExbD